MALPATIPVKLSPEDAGAISISRVVRQQMPAAELFDRIVENVGKDLNHVRRVLAGGTLLEGGTRFRWEPFETSDSEIRANLSRFPDPDPTLRFDPTRCREAILIETSGRPLAIPEPVGAQRKFLRRRSFWDELLGLIEAEQPGYVTYNYREKADRYRLPGSARLGAGIREAAPLLVHSFLARQVRRTEIDAVELLVSR